MAVNLLDLIVSTFLHIILAHGSQSFDWLALYVWIINDYSVDSLITKSLVFMPLIRFIGDAIQEIGSVIDPVGYGPNLWAGPFWFGGEIIGDIYLPALALGMSQKGEIFNKVLVFIGYGLLASSKIANCTWRFVSYFMKWPIETLFIGASRIDSVTCIAGVINDLACCYVIYRKSSIVSAKITKSAAAAQSPLSKALNHLKGSCAARVLVMTIFKIITAIFIFSHPCDGTTCVYEFLRWITITIEYQLYYFDYLLTKNCRVPQKEGNSTKANSIKQKMINE